MDDTRLWDRNRGVIESKKGKWAPGKGVSVSGYSLLDDLVGKSSFFQILLLQVSGRMPDVRVAKWIEACFVIFAYPDVRLWPNQIAALAASGRATASSGIVMGVLSSDSRLFGPGATESYTSFLLGALDQYRAGIPVATLVEKARNPVTGEIRAPGFIRPFVRGDERVPVLQDYAETLGLGTGPHLTLAYAIDDYLREKFSEGVNLAGYIVAFCLDYGLRSSEIEELFTLLVAAGVHACYSEWARRPREAFLPLRCDDVDYVGPPPRKIIGATSE